MFTFRPLRLSKHLFYRPRRWLRTWGRTATRHHVTVRTPNRADRVSGGGVSAEQRVRLPPAHKRPVTERTKYPEQSGAVSSPTKTHLTRRPTMSELAGQVGLRQHATDPIGELIEWATDSQSHHVVVHIGYGYCVSAERPRVRLRAVSEYPALVNSDFDLTDEQRQRIVSAALALMNRPYNTAVLVILGLHKVTGWPIPLWVRGWLNRRPNLDCSDLANRALQAGGIHLFTQDTTLVTPADFQHALEQQAALHHQ